VIRSMSRSPSGRPGPGVRHRVRRRAARFEQFGAFMIEMSLALIIAALVAYGTLSDLVRSQAIQAATTEADSLTLYRQALQDYVDENYGALQFNTPVTKNAITLVAGTAAGQAMQPTVANLIAMGYLNAGFSNQTLVVDGGVFRNVIERQPVGCVTNACNIVGLAYLGSPVLIKGETTSNSLIIGQMLNRLGGLGGASIEGGTANVTGTGGAWTWPNPIDVAQAGVVGARFGFGSSTFAGYVRMNDTRDPNLQGNLTVAGNTTLNNITVNGTSTLTGALTSTGDITARNITATQTMTATGRIRSDNSVGASNVAGCLRAALESGGNVVSRAADCVTRALLANDGLTLSNAAGTARIQANSDTGLLAINTTAGAQNIGLDGAAGRVTAQAMRVDVSATRGAACVNANDIVTDGEVSGTILVCKGGIWRAPGLPEAVAGAACVSNGSLARTSTDETLICRSNVWQRLNDRITTTVVAEIYSGNGVANVPAPTCGTGGTMDISVAALQGGADYGTVPPRNRFEVRVTGTGGWTVTPQMVDQNGTGYTSDPLGNAYSLGWTATTFCRYTV
jgi:type II secretory pathway pseudopilin PulG